MKEAEPICARGVQGVDARSFTDLSSFCHSTHADVQGDRVCLYMPMTPHIVYAMLACARIGAPHSLVFAGFSAEALRQRVINSNARVVITANEAMRGGKTISLKTTVDEALAGCPDVQHVFVQKRTGQPQLDMRMAGDPKKNGRRPEKEWQMTRKRMAGDPKGLTDDPDAIMPYPRH